MQNETQHGAGERRSPRLASCVLASLLLGAPVAAQTTSLASVDSGGNAANGESTHSAMSDDGRYVAFLSVASNLVPGDTNGAQDVFLHDRTTGQTTRVSVGPGGVEANWHSHSPAISGDGRYVGFESEASNLVASDTNFLKDVFVHDTQTSSTVRISLGLAGAESDGASGEPKLSADGRYVAFWSEGTNLVAGDANGWRDVFVRDTLSGLNELISVTSAGVQGNFHSGKFGLDLSSDGGVVAFHSEAGNFNAAGFDNDVYVRDRGAGLTALVSKSTLNAKGNDSSVRPVVSGDGRWVAFESLSTNLVPGDTNGNLCAFPAVCGSDVFLHDTQTGTTTRVSVGPGGLEANGDSARAAIGFDGDAIVFQSAADNLVTGDTNGDIDVFVHHVSTGTTERVSVASGGGEADDESQLAATSADATEVCFRSLATNLVPGDVNGMADVFVRDQTPVAVGPQTYCTAKVNSQGCTPQITWSGVPSATLASTFDVGAQQVINNKSGLLFYGYAASAVPFQGGFKCVANPVRRTPVQNSAGNAPPDDCSGVYSFDFNQQIQSAVDPALTAGATVHAQYWMRDPPTASTTGLTDALQFDIGP